MIGLYSALNPFFREIGAGNIGGYMDNFVSRQAEIKRFEAMFASGEAEFAAIYGRRRVGKTSLVKHVFKRDDVIFFNITGTKKGAISLHLEKFTAELQNAFYTDRPSTELKVPDNWDKALAMLNDALAITTEKKIVLFFDELPWLATAKSGLLEAIDYYWNRYWVDNHNVKLIVCGSAASWMINNIIDDTGGLHNRITLKIRLEPFTLSETKAYLKSRGFNFSNAQVLQAYMCVGGIPFYLRLFKKNLSIMQNINELCFTRDGELLKEFDNLFSSLFDESEAHEELIHIISQNRGGMSVGDILNKAQYSTKGGTFNKRLRELTESGFIIPFTPYKRQRGSYYKVIDEYTLFYLRWIEDVRKNPFRLDASRNYFEYLSQKNEWKVWRGYAFEAVCYKHLRNISEALKLPNGSIATSWYYKSLANSDSGGAQIDVLFDRPDDAITIGEIKYREGKFQIDKQTARQLQSKIDVFKKETKTEKQILLSLILSCDLKPNAYSDALVASVVTLDDFFS
jgi:hypothetical protein